MLAPRRLRARLAALALIACPALGAAPAAAHPAPDHADPGATSDVRRAREATRRFRDVEVARAAGYKATGECAQDPKYGAMGIHYANAALIGDGVLDVTKPEILVYQPTRRGGLRLGAVEYFQADGDQDLATDTDRPSLFGLPFDGPMLGHEPGMPIHYDLHAWLYRHNPAGMFAAWNPDVRCPGGTTRERLAGPA
jgi:hypothetical protein